MKLNKFIDHTLLKANATKNDILNLCNEAKQYNFFAEPNGYLHIGHTKAIGISFGLGKQYNAPSNSGYYAQW